MTVRRVTQNATTRQYINNMHKTLGEMNDLNNKILQNRQYMKASEEPVKAARALAIRRSVNSLNTWKDNLNSAKGIIDAAESELRENVSPRIAEVTDKIISGTNGSKGADEWGIIGSEIKNVADYLMERMNSDYAERKVFGGTNNGVPPFSYDEITNQVSYNGVPVNSQKTEVDEPVLNYTAVDPADYPTYPADKALYIEDTTTPGTYVEVTGQQRTDILNGTDPTPSFSGEKTYSYNAITDFSSVTDSDVICIEDPASPGTYIEVTGQQRQDIIDGTDTTPAFLKTENTVKKYYFNGQEIDPADMNKKDYQLFPGSDPILVDVGKGIEFNADGTIVESTALDISISGVKLTGFGVDEDGDANNFIQLTYDVAKMFTDASEYGKSGNLEEGKRLINEARGMIDKINLSQSSFLSNLTALGVSQQTIEYNLDRLDSEEVILAEAQVNAEFLDTEGQAEAISQYKTIEAAYNATLQMGAKVVPTSIFDFIR